MENISDTSSKENNGLPKDAKFVGTVALGEKGRSSTFLSKLVLVGGYITSIWGSSYVGDAASIAFKEDRSAYDLVKDKGFWKSFKKGLGRPFDPKLWKSNLVEWSTLIGGAFVAYFVSKKIEEHEFAKQFHADPEKVQQLLRQIDRPNLHSPVQNKTMVSDVGYQGAILSAQTEKAMG